MSAERAVDRAWPRHAHDAACATPAWQTAHAPSGAVPTLSRRDLLRGAGAGLGSTLLPALAHAQAWPTRAVKLVVPFPPGGTTDLIGRVLATELGQLLGQPVVVDNRPGAGTVLGVDAVAKSPADGYTLGCIANSFCVNQTLVRKLPYDSLRDLRPIGLLAKSDHVLATHPASGLRTLQDLIAAAHRAPGKLSYASFGNGTSAHIAGEMLCQLANIEMIHVPYKGQAPAMNDLIGGQVTTMFGNWPEFRQHIVSGKLVALGMATAKRTAPEVPTLAEQGVAMESNSWFGVIARTGLPEELVTRLNSAINQALQSPAMRKTLADGGMLSLAGTPEQAASYIRSEIDKYAQVIRRANIALEG